MVWKVIPEDVDVEAVDGRFDESLATLRRVISRFQQASSDEQQTLAREFEELLGMQEKLVGGRVDIVVFGEINAGKSSLLNALIGEPVAAVSQRGGTTTHADRVGWEQAEYTVPGFAGSRVVLVETPGVHEIGGQERSRLAQRAAERADLILFVIAADLREGEFEYLSRLATSNKPILLVLNKTDLYSRDQLTALLDALRERVRGIVRPEDVVSAAADPLEREYEIRHADGTVSYEWRKPPPRVDDLKRRILEVLEQEGRVLVALNAALFAASTSDKLVSTKLRMRERPASDLILRFAVAKGVAVAVNPIPVADVASGLAIDVTMILALSRLYGIEMTRRKAAELLKSILSSTGGLIGVELATHAVMHAINITTLGAGVVVTALPQGIAGAFGSYIVGQAARRYFEHGSWGAGGPKQVVENILRETDKLSILRLLAGRIIGELRENRHALREGTKGSAPPA
jgi:GTPase